jgi:hypothetical protein
VASGFTRIAGMTLGTWVLLTRGPGNKECAPTGFHADDAQSQSFKGPDERQPVDLAMRLHAQR